MIARAEEDLAVERDSEEEIAERIRTEMEGRIAYFSQYPEKIDQRLAQLEKEWTIERILGVKAGSVAVFGVALSLLKGEKRWLALPALAGAVLLDYSLRGRDPYVDLLRRLGFRKTKELEQEKYALEVLRGDYRPTPASTP